VTEQDRRGRAAHAGRPSAAADESKLGIESADFEHPGEPACWAHLVCPECGAMISEGHRSGCQWSGADAAPDRKSSL
jgi:hypothetical protein